MHSENKIRAALIALIITVLAILAFLAPTPTHDTVPPPELLMADSTPTFVHVAEAHEIEKPVLSAPLKRMCACESSGDPDAEPRQFYPDGTIVKNPTSSAIGMCQILEGVHGKRAEELDLDLRSEEGNITFAILLYNEHGSKPWRESRSCHGL